MYVDLYLFWLLKSVATKFRLREKFTSKIFYLGKYPNLWYHFIRWITEVYVLHKCRYFSGLIIGCLQGVSKEELLAPRYSPCGMEYWTQHPMVWNFIHIPIPIHSHDLFLGSWDWCHSCWFVQSTRTTRHKGYWLCRALTGGSSLGFPQLI